MTDSAEWGEFREFSDQLFTYLTKHAYRAFFRFEAGKDMVTGVLYHQRGKYARPLLHSAMMALLFFGFTFGPKIVQADLANGQTDQTGTGGQVLGVSLNDTNTVTVESDKPPSSVTAYTVQGGDTLSSIAVKFGVSIDTVKWANQSTNWQKIKPGDTVQVPPVTGIVYKVKPGDTIYSIAKTFQADSQTIADFPFNTFTDDETFAIAAGQTLIIPGGVMPAAVASPIALVLTPSAGAVSATGSFVWPTHGIITQQYSWFHKADDIANNIGTPIVAADSGEVVRAGWDTTGYGNMVMVDHHNGYMTLYAHMSLIEVQVGQTVDRGNEVGKMGETGHATGPHLHFEIRYNGVLENPLDYLK